MTENTFNDKEKQFEDLWDGITPKGVNRNKSLKFRQYILEHVRQMKKPLNRENAFKYSPTSINSSMSSYIISMNSSNGSIRNMISLIDIFN